MVVCLYVLVMQQTGDWVYPVSLLDCWNRLEPLHNY